MVAVIRLLCFFLISSIVSGQNISGTWTWTYKDKHQSTIILEQNGTNTFKGNYCSVFFNGMKIDCVVDQSSNGIFLTKTKENIFTGTFESSFSNTSGALRLEYLANTNSLKLEILKEPGGAYYLPNQITFSR